MRHETSWREYGHDVYVLSGVVPETVTFRCAIGSHADLSWLLEASDLPCQKNNLRAGETVQRCSAVSVKLHKWMVVKIGLMLIDDEASAKLCLPVVGFHTWLSIRTYPACSGESEFRGLCSQENYQTITPESPVITCRLEVIYERIVSVCIA